MARYVVSGTVTVGIWRMVNGVWQRFTTQDVGVFNNVGGPGVYTVGWSMQNTFALGAGVTDFGVTIESASSEAALTGMGVSWAVQGASGDRSATPAGEQAQAVVRP